MSLSPLDYVNATIRFTYVKVSIGENDIFTLKLNQKNERFKNAWLRNG